MPFAAALSEHPIAAAAAGEVLGTILEHGGVGPDLAVVFASSAHVEFLGEISAAIEAVLRPRTLVGAATTAVVGGRREVEGVPALSVWAAWAGPMPGVRVAADPDAALAAIGADLPVGATLLLLADPRSFPAETVVDELAWRRPDVSVVGGLASTAGVGRGNVGSVLLLGGDVHRDGAVGVVIPGEHVVAPVVSQGCRPIGDVMAVTAADRHFVLELAGRPALERLTEVTGSASPADRALLQRGLHLGVVVNETKDDFTSDDFLVRPVLGGDRGRGVLAIGADLAVGSAVQFHVRDPASAHVDLCDKLQDVRGDGALLFSGDGRGRALFGADDHDASTVAELLGTDAVAGMFCDRELGPVGGRNFVHDDASSILVLADI